VSQEFVDAQGYSPIHPDQDAARRRNAENSASPIVKLSSRRIIGAAPGRLPTRAPAVPPRHHTSSAPTRSSASSAGLVGAERGDDLALVEHREPVRQALELGQLRRPAAAASPRSRASIIRGGSPRSRRCPRRASLAHSSTAAPGATARGDQTFCWLPPTCRDRVPGSAGADVELADQLLRPRRIRPRSVISSRPHESRCWPRIRFSAIESSRISARVVAESSGIVGQPAP